MKLKSLLTIVIFMVLAGHTYSQVGLKPLITFYPENKTNKLFISHCGDINNDGKNDFNIYEFNNGFRKNKLFLGKTKADTMPDVVFYSGDSKSLNVLYYFGDVNNDGFDDFMNSYSSSGFNCTYQIYLGSSILDTVPDYIFRLKNYFGFYSIGDINGDDSDDLAICDYDALNNPFGGIMFFLGGEKMNACPDITIIDTIRQGGLGFGLCGCDINGDGYKDIIMGTNLGYTELIMGGRNVEFSKRIKFTKLSGNNIRCLGDIDGDGCEDFAFYRINEIQIFSGKTQEQKITISGKNLSISNSDDLNGDGCSDFLIGKFEDTDNYTGSVDLYLGNKDWNLNPYLILRGETQLHYFGKGIDILGDINGDGKKEIGINEMNSEDTEDKAFSRVYIYSIENISGITDNEQKAHMYDIKINPNYPNPFNASTTITYELKKQFFVTAGIYNCLGQKLKTVINEEKPAGLYKTIWDGTDENNQALSSGMYFFRMSAHTIESNTTDYTTTIKIIYLK